MAKPTTPSTQFWRDPSLPFIEARATDDARAVCYDRHTHDTFSIGAITGGRSKYHNGRSSEQVGPGALVIINPELAHACETVGEQAWSFRMLYVDVKWLADLQHQLGFDPNEDFRPFTSAVSTDETLYRGLNALYCALMDEGIDPGRKHEAAILFFTQAHQRLQGAPRSRPLADGRLKHAAEYINENFARSLRLEEICAAAELSPCYLVRAFKQRYGLTPHAYLTDRRIRYCKAQLRDRVSGRRSVADVALAAGFADQPHLQRTFKRLVAATPRQYMIPVPDRRPRLKEHHSQTR